MKRGEAFVRSVRIIRQGCVVVGTVYADTALKQRASPRGDRLGLTGKCPERCVAEQQAEVRLEHREIVSKLAETVLDLRSVPREVVYVVVGWADLADVADKARFACNTLLVAQGPEETARHALKG